MNNTTSPNIASDLVDRIFKLVTSVNAQLETVERIMLGQMTLTEQQAQAIHELDSRVCKLETDVANARDIINGLTDRIVQQTWDTRNSLNEEPHP